MVGMGALVLASMSSVASADRLAIEAPTLGSSMERPTRGMNMTAVEQQFGAPETRSRPVGNPPIIRWFYPAFTVYFERNRVIHTVIARR